MDWTFTQPNSEDFEEWGEHVRALTDDELTAEVRRVWDRRDFLHRRIHAITGNGFMSASKRHSLKHSLIYHDTYLKFLKGEAKVRASERALNGGNS